MCAKKKSEVFESLVEHGLVLTPAHFPVTCDADKTMARCSCRNPECSSPGKHPIVDGWNSDPEAHLCDATSLKDAVSQWPEINAAVVTGQPLPDGGYLGVLDFDGIDVLDELVDHLGSDSFLETPAVLSGREEGGFHLYFRFERPPASRDRIEVDGKTFHVELKGTGKCVIAPGSLHYTGRHYEWMDDASINDVAIADAPPWLEDAGSGPGNGTAPHAAGAPVTSTPGWKKILQGPVQQGSRNETLHRYVWHLRCRGLEWDEIEHIARLAGTSFQPPLQNAEIQAVVASARKHAPSCSSVHPEAEWRTSDDIQSQTLPKPQFLVDRLIPLPTLMLLSGAPKVGKSLLALDLACAVATGTPFLGEFGVLQSEVAYFALEDSDARMRKRLDAQSRELGIHPIRGVSFSYHPGSVLPDFATEVEKHLEANPEVRLVVIDTLARVWGGSGKTANAYHHETKMFAPLHTLAHDRGVAIVCIHHTRKAQTEDFISMSSGTHALPGIADTNAVLTRIRHTATGKLEVNSRDLDDEPEFLLTRRPGRMVWRYMGRAEDVQASEVQRVILDILGDGKDWQKRDIVSEVQKRTTTKSASAIGKTVERLAAIGGVYRVKNGVYRLPTATSPFEEDLDLDEEMAVSNAN